MLFIHVNGSKSRWPCQRLPAAKTLAMHSSVHPLPSGVASSTSPASSTSALSTVEIEPECETALSIEPLLECETASGEDESECEATLSN